MVSSDLRAVTLRLDVLRDIMIEVAAALPPDRAAGVVSCHWQAFDGTPVRYGN